jgi:hypothetical protein
MFVPVIMRVNVELHSFDAGLVLARGMDVKIPEIELPQLAFERFERNAEIEHCANEHVATDAAENIEIKRFHDFPAASALIWAAA